MTAKTKEKAPQPRPLRRWGVILPLVIFVSLAGLF